MHDPLLGRRIEVGNRPPLGVQRGPPRRPSLPRRPPRLTAALPAAPQVLWRVVDDETEQTVTKVGAMGACASGLPSPSWAPLLTLPGPWPRPAAPSSNSWPWAAAGPAAGQAWLRC